MRNKTTYLFLPVLAALVVGCGSGNSDAEAAKPDTSNKPSVEGSTGGQGANAPLVGGSGAEDK